MQFKARLLLKVIIMIINMVWLSLVAFTIYAMNVEHGNQLDMVANYILFPSYALFGLMLLFYSNRILSSLIVNNDGVIIKRLLTKKEFMWKDITLLKDVLVFQQTPYGGGANERRIEIYDQSNKKKFSIKTTYSDDALDFVLETASNNGVKTE